MLSDQPILNHLFWSGQLPFATLNENRQGGTIINVDTLHLPIVKEHTIRMTKSHFPHLEKKSWWTRRTKSLAYPYKGAHGSRWIGEEYNLTNDEGLFLHLDGSVARVVHMYDRFGKWPGTYFHDEWVMKQSWLADSLPDDFV